MIRRILGIMRRILEVIAGAVLVVLGAIIIYGCQFLFRRIPGFRIEEIGLVLVVVAYNAVGCMIILIGLRGMFGQRHLIEWAIALNKKRIIIVLGLISAVIVVMYGYLLLNR